MLKLIMGYNSALDELQWYVISEIYRLPHFTFHFTYGAQLNICAVVLIEATMSNLIDAKTEYHNTMYATRQLQLTEKY